MKIEQERYPKKGREPRGLSEAREAERGRVEQLQRAQVAREAERERQAREREAREAERVRERQALEAREAERERAEQRRRAQEAREAERERARREQERRAREVQERERERLHSIEEYKRKRRQAIDSWNRHFISYRKSVNEPVARFVLEKMGLDLYDDQVGEKFFEMFCYSPGTKTEKERLFLEVITTAFDAHQLKRYRDVINPMADIFIENREQIRSEIESKIKENSVLRKFRNSIKDENINQGVKEDLTRLKWFLSGRGR